MLLSNSSHYLISLYPLALFLLIVNERLHSSLLNIHKKIHKCKYQGTSNPSIERNPTPHPLRRRHPRNPNLLLLPMSIPVRLRRPRPPIQTSKAPLASSHGIPVQIRGLPPKRSRPLRFRPSFPRWDQPRNILPLDMPQLQGMALVQGMCRRIYRMRVPIEHRSRDEGFRSSRSRFDVTPGVGDV